ncbi:MAG: TIR domain-containing protein, partial [Gammaproteobacteria bacterium]|nr:TIR domain-containing protein [Gammaproteobacteria bacterium]
MPESSQPRIFVSYARSDGKDVARRLRQRLIDEHGFSLWQDLADMEGGRDWWLQIMEAIRSVEYLVLVMTPAALASDVVRREWRLARQEGVCVVPVKGAPNLNFDSLSSWMRSAHFVDVETPEQWTQFVRTLEGPCTIPRVAFMAPDPPSDFVERSREFDRLVSQLLDKSHAEPLAITATLQGAGGFGKTTLASALCHDEHVQDAFYQGILWVTLGEQPGDLTSKVNSLIVTLSGKASELTDVDSASARLAELLADQTMLLVIDDVWNGTHVQPFLRGGTWCARLITTRNSSTLPPVTRKVAVDAMTESEAVTLLCFGLPDEASDAVQRLATDVGEWPLLLKLVNGALRRRVLYAGQSMADALSYADHLLKRRGLTAFDVDNAEARHQAVAITLGASLELLTEAERRRFIELGVFPEDVPIPLETVGRLWQATTGFDNLDTEELCSKLFSLSLLLALDLTTHHIRLHDVIRHYLLRECEATLSELHGALLDAYALTLRGEACGGHHAWWTLPENEPYTWHYLSYHLTESGRVDELRELLLHFEWLRRKAAVTDLNALLSDYDAVPPEEALGLVQGALRLSAHVLSDDLSQLPSQLIGRLGHFTAPAIQGLLAQAKAMATGAWLRPLNTALTPPAGSLIRNLEGHAGTVTGVALSADGRSAVSASDDHTLKVWDVSTGAVRHTLEGHAGGVT